MLPQGRGLGHPAVRRGAAHRLAVGSSSRRSWTPGTRPAGSAQAIARSSGTSATSSSCPAGGLRRGSRYVVRVVRDGESLARQTGLLDGRGRPVRGLPPQVVSGGRRDAEAAWRGAFLAHGSLTEPGRSSALEVTCPGPEAALALVGAARRLGIAAKAREVRGIDRVVIRDGDTISAMLTRLGAHDAVLAWEERRMRREVRGTANRLANFDDANLRRSARAAVAAGARVRAGVRDPRRRHPRAPARGRRAAAGAQAGVARGAGPARRPAADQGRRRGPHPAAAGDGGQARRRAGHPGHRGEPEPGDARPLSGAGAVVSPRPGPSGARTPAGAVRVTVVTGIGSGHPTAVRGVRAVHGGSRRRRS